MMVDTYPSEVRIIIPSGLRKVLSLDTKTKAFLGVKATSNGVTVYTVSKG